MGSSHEVECWEEVMCAGLGVAVDRIDVSVCVASTNTAMWPTTLPSNTVLPP